MKIFKISIILYLFLGSTIAIASDFTGFAEAKGVAYSQRAVDSDPWAEGVGTLFLKGEQAIGEGILTGSARLEDSSARGFEGRFDLADRHKDRPSYTVRDLWLRAPLAASTDLQAGRFELGWGKTDGYSPADAFLPRDLTDPFADEKLPLWGARLNGQWDWLRAEAVGVPVTTPWRLPELGSRNAPLNLNGLPYREDDTAPPKPGFGALRLLATFGDWDLGAWGRFGVRPAPILEFTLDPESTPFNPQILIKRRWAREEGGGVEISRLVGSWILRGEGALLFCDDGEVGDAVIWSLSVERSIADTNIIATLAGNAGEKPKGDAALFDRAMLPVFMAAVNQAFEWGEGKVVWSAGLGHGDGLVKAELGYNFDDNWKITGGGELPYGSDDGPFGALSDARRARLALRYSW